ncbi:MAG: PD-(D/E)XK nuclease domain-containing protein [Eubacteriaceae bacterium]|nr:PD-(D/E)XK nuclease domain-containing protein [Eubacteriaceae bacterium]
MAYHSKWHLEYAKAKGPKQIRSALRKDALSWAKSAMPINESKADARNKAFLESNAQEAEAIINDLLENVLSVRDGIVVHGDFAVRQERYYHLITTALLACSNWETASEAESGDGYPDTLCTNKGLNAAVIIEEKFSAKGDDESLAAKAQEAMDQIIEARYAKGIEGYSTLVAVGIAYASRKCKIVIKYLK